MEMIFDKKKFYLDLKKHNIESSKITKKWVDKCNGKSVDFCNQLGFLIDSNWCIKK